MKDSKETLAKIEDPAPVIEIDSIVKRLEELEGRCTQLETTLKDAVTFDTLAARLTGHRLSKKIEPSANCHQKRNLPFMQEWWQLVKQKKKLDRQLPRLKLRKNKSNLNHIIGDYTHPSHEAT